MDDKQSADVRRQMFPAGPWTVETVLTHLSAVVESNDKRYEQRFDASQKALQLSFDAQKDAINAAFAAQREAVNAALSAADRAVQKAELASDKRFEGVNEFRATLADQQRTLIPRAEVDVIVRGLNMQIDALEKRLEGSIAERLSQIAALQRSHDTSSAERVGLKGGWGYAVGVVGLVLTILAVIGAIVTLVSRLGP
jgi:hypothetical protein